MTTTKTIKVRVDAELSSILDESSKLYGFDTISGYIRYLIRKHNVKEQSS